jgi:hypothetical protein
MGAIAGSSVGLADAAPSPATISAVPVGSLFTPMSPTRVLDTRNGTGTGGKVAPLGASGWLDLNLSTDVPAGTTAVVLNLTGVNPSTATYITAQSADSGTPGSFPVSNLNLVPHEVRPNLVTVQVGSSRTVLISNFAGTVDLVADLAGYYASGTGAGFTSIQPTRVLDTRSGTGVGGTIAPVGPHGSIVLDLSGAVPASATAVTLNLTGVDPTVGTFVVAWPDGQPRPTGSNLNLVPGEILPNLVTVALGVDRKIDLYNLNGTVDLVADLAGYYASGQGNPFYALTPTRVLDTRDAAGHSVNPIGPAGVRLVDMSGWLPASAVAAVFNLTGTNTTARTYVTAWPAGGSKPNASNLNLVAGQTAANLSTVALGAGDTLDVGNFQGDVDIVIDLAGYFAPPLAPCASNCAIAWGTNAAGVLGNGSTGGIDMTPTQVPGVSGLASVSAGGPSYALGSDGTVYGWGGDNGGDGLGVGNTPNGLSPTPVPIAGLPKIVQLTSDSVDAYAVDVNQQAWAWGRNNIGQLGVGNSAPVSHPVRISLPGPVSTVAAGSTNYALLTNGTVYAWGDNSFGQLGNGTITPGCNGTNSPSCYVNSPQQVPGLTGVAALYAGGTVFAVKTDGTVWAWGSNIEGELGIGTMGDRGCYSAPSAANCVATRPVQVPALAGVTTITGNGAMFAMKSDGSVLGWGDNTSGLLSLAPPSDNCGTTPPAQGCYFLTPVTISGLSNTADISAGSGYLVAAKTDGTVWDWGQTPEVFPGATGSGPWRYLPTEIAGLSSVTKVSAGNGYILALATNP